LASCLVIFLLLNVGLLALFAAFQPSRWVGLLTELVLLSLVMARLRSVRVRDVVALAATLWLTVFLSFVVANRWIWPDYGFSAASMARAMSQPAVLVAALGHVVLAVLLLAGVDPQLRGEIRSFVRPGRRGFVLRLASVAVLVGCAVWTGRNLLSVGPYFKFTVITSVVQSGGPRT
jgi:hypothetical protein